MKKKKNCVTRFVVNLLCMGNKFNKLKFELRSKEISLANFETNNSISMNMCIHAEEIERIQVGVVAVIVVGCSMESSSN